MPGLQQVWTEEPLVIAHCAYSPNYALVEFNSERIPKSQVERNDIREFQPAAPSAFPEVSEPVVLPIALLRCRKAREGASILIAISNRRMK